MAQISAKFRNNSQGGLTYWCQGCKHAHIVWIAGQSPEDGRPRWGWNGDLLKPVFTPSVRVFTHEPDNWNDEAALDREMEEVAKRRAAGDLTAKVKTHEKTLCHTFVGCNGAQPGEVIFLSDCVHELAGTVQPFPDLPPHMQGHNWHDGGDPEPEPAPAFRWIKQPKE